MAEAVGLPEGFELDDHSLPQGFVLDQPHAPVSQQSNAPQVGGVETALRSAGQGAGFGVTDKLGSLIAAATAKAYGQLSGDKDYNRPIGEMYNEALQANKVRENAGAEQHPITSFVSDVAGSLGTGGEILKAANLTGKGLKTAVGQALTLNAAREAGESNKLSDIPGNILSSSPIAAAVGALTHGVVNIGGKTIGNIAKNLGVYSPAETTLISKTLTPEELAKATDLLKQQAANGEKVSLLNTGDPVIDAKMQNLADKLIKSPTEGGLRYNAALKEQLKQTPLETEQTLRGQKSGNYFQNIEDLQKSRKAEAAPLFKQAYEKGSNIPTLFENGRAADQSGILGQPLSKADQELAGKFEDVASDPRFAQYAKEFPNLKPNSVEMLHNIRQSVDADKSTLEKNLNGPSPTADAKRELRGLNNFRSNLSNVMYKATGSTENNPGLMEQADKIYSNSYAIQNAHELGRNYDSFNSPDEFAQKVNDIKQNGSKTDIDAVKNGIIQRMLDKTLTGQNATNSAKNIINSEENRRALSQVFNPNELKDVTNKLQKQADVTDTVAQLVNKNPANVIPDDHAHAAAYAVMNPSTTSVPHVKLFESLSNFITDKFSGITEKNSKELAKTLLDPNRSIDKLLETAQKNASKGAVIKAFLPALIASKTGQLYTQSNPEEANASEVTPENAMQLAQNDYRESAKTTHYKPTPEEVKNLADLKLKNSLREEYKKAEPIVHTNMDEEELNRIINHSK